jgi:RES domain-containing protein
MDLWRISRFHSLSGEGGRLYAGRWNSVGNPVVYLAPSPAGALIEVLIHLELSDDEPPPPYTLLRISVSPKIHGSTLRAPAGEAWKTDLPLTRKIGDAWLASQRSAIARVPSVILPHTHNYLLNPLHSNAKGIQVVESERFTFDPRLARISRN